MNIDQRLEFLVQSTESLHGTVGALVDRVYKVADRVDRLAETSERHEREINRFRSAMRAALQAWLNENGDEAAG